MPISFKIAVAVFGAMLILSLVQIVRLTTVNNQLVNENKELTVEYAKCNTAVTTLTASIKTQNNAIRELERKAKERRAQASRDIAKAKADTASAYQHAADIAASPDISADKCENANQLINKEIQHDTAK